MKLYTFPGAPNPRRVHVYLAEKGLEIPLERVDILKRANRSPEFLARVNPLGGIPVLELDDGSHLAESVAICRYLEALHPAPPLFGRTPEEIGRVEMWIRRLELNLMVPVGMVWIHGSPLTKAVMKQQIPEVAEQYRAVVARSFELFDRELAGRAFFAGEVYTMADVVGLTHPRLRDRAERLPRAGGGATPRTLAPGGVGPPERGGGQALSVAVSLEPAGPADRAVLARMLELYVHDLSEAFEIELGPDGRFGYAHLPRYFEEPERRFAFLIRAGGHLAGFALVTRGSPASEDPERPRRRRVLRGAATPSLGRRPHGRHRALGPPARLLGGPRRGLEPARAAVLERGGARLHARALRAPAHRRPAPDLERLHVPQPAGGLSGALREEARGELRQRVVARARVARVVAQRAPFGARTSPSSDSMVAGSAWSVSGGSSLKT